MSLIPCPVALCRQRPAFQHAAGRVATLREVSVLLGILLARGKPGWRIWLGAILVVAGVVLTAI